jgi:murein DD-endopeptidase MepM/ murein hydrolase activator NlpD
LKANNLAIYVIADGKVAYARMNSPGLCPRGVKVCGPEYWRSGLGLTIIVDHGNGVYSLYAHLAQDAGRSCSIYEVDDDLYKMAVQRGDPVKKGQLIGYMGQVDYRYGIAKPEPADGVTGNAANELSEAVQVHFELFLAKPGRGSDFLVSEIVPKEDRGIIDPTKFISGLWQASSPRITPHPPTNAE